MTSTMLNRPRPSTVDSTIASGRNGITRNHSVTRKVMAPTTPPKYPDTRPITVPITIEISVASRPTNSDTRAPQISRVSTERPFSSVPSQYSEDGGPRTGPLAAVTSRPLRLARSGAASAATTKKVRMPSPTMPLR